MDLRRFRWASRRALTPAVCGTLAFALLLTIAIVRAPHRQIPGSLFVSDGFGYYIYLPSVVINGDLDLTNQIAHQPSQVEHWTFAQVPQTGKPGNIFQIGPALLWFPFFVATHLVLTSLHWLGFDVPRDGFGWAYELPVYCGSFLYGLLGIWFIWRLVKEFWGNRIGTGSIALIVLASPVAAYVWFEPDMPHILSMTLIAMLFYYLQKAYVRGVLRLRMWAGLGSLTGLIGLIRVPDLLVCLALLCVGAALVWRRRRVEGGFSWRGTVAPVIVYSLAAGAAFLPQLLVWKVLYGKMFSMPPNPFYTEMSWVEPHLFNYLFSTCHGLVSWTPILLPATVGLIWGAARGPMIMRWSLPVLVAAVYFNSSIYRWWVGASFGERRMVDYAVLFALGLGYLLSLKPSLLSKGPLCLASFLCGFNWVLMVRYFTHDLPEYGYVSWYDLYIRTLDFPLRALAKFRGS